jgi:hypothetical protein
MVQFLFEDDEKSPISIMLSSSSYGNNIHFSSGNDYLRLEINKLLKQDSNTSVYVFMDCPPNREDICTRYEDLCMIFDSDSRVNVFPIICIEEIVLQMLNKYYSIEVPNRLVNLVENTVEDFNWAGVSQSFKDDKYIGSSLEHLYKYIISQCIMKCFHNVNGDIDGKFYKEDCNCEEKYCQTLKCRDGLRLKAERLYTTLPIFKAINNEIIEYWDSVGIQHGDCDIETAFEKIQDKYDKICDSMNIDDFIVCKG